MLNNKVKIYFILLFFFIHSTFNLYANESVSLAEGKVSVFKFECDYTLSLTTAFFIKVLEKNIIEVEIAQETVRAYISDENYKKFGMQLTPGAYLLLISKHRLKYLTKWDVIGIETPLLQGECFEDGQKSFMNKTIQQKLLFEAKQLIESLSAYKGNIIHGTFSSTNSSNGFGIDLFQQNPEESGTNFVPPEIPVIPDIPEIPEPDATTDIYVNAVTGDDANSGTALNPLKTITHAMTHADGVNTAVIHVANGTYNYANGEKFPINVTDRITMLGESTNTIVDGGGSGTLFSVNNLSSFTVDTITMQNAQIGLDIVSSTVTVQDSQFVDFIDGPGANDSIMYLDGTNLTVQDTTFSSFIKGIDADDGSGSSTTIIDNCDFSNSTNYSIEYECANSSINITDSSFHDGWGVKFENDIFDVLTVAIDKCRFSGALGNNIIDRSSRGFSFFDTTASISNSLFYNISGFRWFCYLNGGDPVQFYNCVFNNNTSEIWPTSSLIHIGYQDNCVIKNCSFTNNNNCSAIGVANGGWGGVEFFDISNNLLFNNDSGHFYYTDESIPSTTYYTVVEVNAMNGGAFPENNIDADPEYKTAGASDYRPDFATNSPLIDAGIDDANTPPDDYDGNPRPIDGDAVPGAVSDIGAYEYQGSGSDPVISGRIYNSKTGETIDDAVIGLYRKNNPKAESVQQTGNFSFNVLPGVYYLAAYKSGYHFPSVHASTTESQGKYFEVVDGVDVSVDIPLDSGTWLELEKTANKHDLEIGEMVTVNCEITNPYYFDDFEGITLKESLPPGLKYVSDSVRFNNAKYSDPVKTGKDLLFNVGTVMSKQTLNISYQMVVSTGAVYSDVKSMGVCIQNVGAGLASALEVSDVKTLEFEVIPDTLFYTGTVIGRVIIKEDLTTKSTKYTKINKKFELITEYGLKIKTDKNGMFHIPNVMPGRHLIKLKVKSEKYKSKPVLFEVREGGITNVEIKIEERNISRRDAKTQRKYTESPAFAEDDHSFNIVALGEIEIRHKKISGDKSILELDDDFEEGTSVTGRGAVYVEGELNGKI